ncbi:hypothetical protein DXG01_008365 [Tephrocybe rancida]|nr:hypothetical protein DXG01_008365 [Tephrocybe rancida]
MPKSSRNKKQDKKATDVKSTHSALSQSSLSSLKAAAKSVTSTVKCKAKAVLSSKKQKKPRHDSPEPANGDASSVNHDSSPEPRSRKAHVEDVPDEDEGLENVEDADTELARMSKKWTSIAYAFYEPIPKIIYDKLGNRGHQFTCAAKGCRYKANRFLNTKDRSSTSNLIKHVKSCWGQEAWDGAVTCGDADTVRKALSDKGNLKSGSIFKIFQRKGKAQVTFSHRQHTRSETRAEIVRWIAECVRPFKIVEDRGFRCLMKTGRPEYWIPSAATVSRDVRLVFARARERIGKILQTSPNHRAFIALTTHFELEGVPISIVLDIVEVPESHTGKALAEAFSKVLHEFGIADKSMLKPFNTKAKSTDETSAEDQELDELENEADFEEDMLQDLDDEEQEPQPNDDLSDWVDEAAEMTPDELAELQEAVKPVRLLLVKLRRLSFKIINSTTILLPEWERTLKKLKLQIKLMPRDVRTRWNSTYDMLRFALQYKEAIVAMTGNRENNLRRFELSGKEWDMAQRMADALQPLKDATLLFSAESLNLAFVLPIMDRIVPMC